MCYTISMPKQKHTFLPQQTLLIAASTVILVIVVGMFQFGRMKSQSVQSPATSNETENVTLPKATLVPIDGTWKKVTIHRPEIKADAGAPAYDISFSIPKTWSMKEVNIRPKADFDGADCKDYQIQDEKKEVNVLLWTDCLADVIKSKGIYPLPMQKNIVEVSTNTFLSVSGLMDHHIVRYHINNQYLYGSIGISHGKTIDILKNDIYPRIHMELGDWNAATSENVTPSNLQIIDTIVSSMITKM